MENSWYNTYWDQDVLLASSSSFLWEGAQWMNRFEKRGGTHKNRMRLLQLVLLLVHQVKDVEMMNAEFEFGDSKWPNEHP